nr:MAG TPA: Large Terminase [Caudoviricetes sp.]
MADLSNIENDENFVRKELARREHEKYMQYMWQKTGEKFLVGIHTKELCRLIDEAFENFEKGLSTFLVVTMPFRHGKSDCLSRYLPSHFLGEHPDCEVMLVTYASALAEGFSRFARNLLRTKEFKSLYPDVSVSKENGGVQQWGIENHIGGCVASGLTSGLTGKGYHLGLLDDYCASRAEAESETIRNSAWEHFTNDFLTRRAPVSITIVLATPWHVDDIIGRIKDRLNPNSENYDEEFPKFNIVSFPAINGEVDIKVKDKSKYGDRKYHTEHKKYDYLFPERFSEEWYRQQFASLGSYAASALLQCRPQLRGGNLFVTDKIQWHDSESDFPRTKYYRVWDLAHTAKQTQKADPDWTSGTLLTYTKIDGVWHLWIKNVSRIRGKSPERDNYIRAVSDNDGNNVSVAVENSLDSKDAISNMQTILNGRYVVKPLNINIDKVARAGYIEPIFEAGHVHVLRGDWNLDWLNEVKEFPSGKHDDQVDNLTAGYLFCCQQTPRISVGRVLGV